MFAGVAEHDLLFKRAFRVPEHAAGELAAVLPKTVLDTIDKDSLELVQGDFVGQKLDERFSDALFGELPRHARLRVVSPRAPA